MFKNEAEVRQSAMFFYTVKKELINQEFLCEFFFVVVNKNRNKTNFC